MFFLNFLPLHDSGTMVNILCVYIFTRRFLSGLAKGLVLYGKPSNLGGGEGGGRRGEGRRGREEEREQ